MPEAEINSTGEAKALEALLIDAEAREKRARRRALLYTVVPILVGLLFLALSLTKVSRLQKTASELNDAITASNAKLKELSLDIRALEAQKAEAEDAMKAARPVLEKSQAAPAKEALRKVDDALRSSTVLINRPKVEPPISSGQPKPVESKEKEVKEKEVKEKEVTGKEVTADTDTVGFLDRYHYRGRDQSVIKVEVIPGAQNLPVTPFSYKLDGVSEFSPRTAQQMTFSFTLDKSKNNPSYLWLFLDFLDPTGEGYSIRITTPDGQSRISVRPNGISTKTIKYRFDII